MTQRIFPPLPNYLAALFVALLTAACSSEDETGAYIGYVEAEYVYASAREAGRLISAPLKEGDRAAPGDVLFSLDDDQQRAVAAQAEARAAEAEARLRDMETGARPLEIEALEAQLAEAETRLSLAKAERDRWMPLVRAGDASQAKGDQVTSDYEAALARVKAAEDAIGVARLAARDAAQEAAAASVAAAKASLDEARWRLGERTIVAQTGGRIEELFHREGEFVPAGAPVLAILPDDALKVRFFVPQAELSAFAVGDKVLARADGVDASVPATVSYIAQEAEFTPPVIYSADSRDKLVFLVEARLDGRSARLHPGLPVDVLAP